MDLSKNWNIQLSTDDILRGQGADPQIVRTSKPKLLKAAERALAEGLGLIHPMALTAEVTVREHRHERILLVSGMALTGTAGDTPTQRSAACCCGRLHDRPGAGRCQCTLVWPGPIVRLGIGWSGQCRSGKPVPTGLWQLIANK